MLSFIDGVGKATIPFVVYTIKTSSVIEPIRQRGVLLI